MRSIRPTKLPKGKKKGKNEEKKQEQQRQRNQQQTGNAVKIRAHSPKMLIEQSKYRAVTAAAATTTSRGKKYIELFSPLSPINFQY